MLRYPLKIFDSIRNTENEIKFYKEIIAKFKELTSKWKEFRSVRSVMKISSNWRRKHTLLRIYTDIQGVLSKSTVL